MPVWPCGSAGLGRVPLRDIVGETTDVIEQLCIEAALELTSDNRASASEMLGLSRQSLYVKLRRYGLGDLGGDADKVRSEPAVHRAIRHTKWQLWLTMICFECQNFRQRRQGLRVASHSNDKRRGRFVCISASASAPAWMPPDRASQDWLLIGFAFTGFRNVLWSVLYFRLHRPDGSLAEVALLWAQPAVRWLMVRRAG